MTGTAPATGPGEGLRALPGPARHTDPAPGTGELRSQPTLRCGSCRPERGWNRTDKISTNKKFRLWNKAAGSSLLAPAIVKDCPVRVTLSTVIFREGDPFALGIKTKPK